MDLIVVNNFQLSHCSMVFSWFGLVSVEDWTKLESRSQSRIQVSEFIWDQLNGSSTWSVCSLLPHGEDIIPIGASC